MTNLTATTETVHQPESKLRAWLIRAGVALGSLSGLALLVPPVHLVQGDPTE